jgi:hypothetical protein
MTAATHRPPGGPLALARPLRLRLADEGPALLDQMIQQARMGDTRALAWCLDRAIGFASTPTPATAGDPR